ncbi:hypothetical protein B0T22DRAFT_475920 [Podospora appendiculata]|uniref:Uncharacterized protein n=1 Tax=Podospora appendiculata TaxID=314037 RepID=A0AAE1CFX8_9PEZI|nr:hypothetical protein B0T22DRAFT_475920 [Podospora appendiculata]
MDPSNEANPNPPPDNDAVAQTEPQTQTQTQNQNPPALHVADDDDKDKDVEMVTISPRLETLLKEIGASPFRAKTNPTEANNHFWKQTFVRRPQHTGFKLGTHCHAAATARALAAELNTDTAEEDTVAASLASLGGSAWCSSRIGQSETVLPDGRTILIGGKHLDSNQTPAVVFNDVIVIPSRGGAADHTAHLSAEDVTIYTYRPKVFPPVYNHTATFCTDEDGGQYIYIIGGLGPDTDNNADPRGTPRRKETMVHVLDLDDFRMYQRATDGDVPPVVDTGHPDDRFVHVRTAATVTFERDTQLIEFRGGALGGYAFYLPDSSWIRGWAAGAKRDFQQFAGIETSITQF